MKSVNGTLGFLAEGRNRIYGCRSFQLISLAAQIMWIMQEMFDYQLNKCSTTVQPDEIQSKPWLPHISFSLKTPLSYPPFDFCSGKSSASTRMCVCVCALNFWFISADGINRKSIANGSGKIGNYDSTVIATSDKFFILIFRFFKKYLIGISNRSQKEKENNFSKQSLP